MKHYITALILAGGLAAAQANAACNYPVAPGKFPDGNQASKDEMLAAKSQDEMLMPGVLDRLESRGVNRLG